MISPDKVAFYGKQKDCSVNSVMNHNCTRQSLDICGPGKTGDKKLMTNIIKCIRSGGQTGVDRAALDTARKYGIKICGWCPKGGWAEDYPSPPGLLAVYPELNETPSAGTSQRTRWNMRDTDAILTIMPESSAESKGTQVGLEEGVLLQKPMYTARGAEDIPGILAWLDTLPDDLDLCIGGPRASECPEAYQMTVEILSVVFGEFS